MVKELMIKIGKCIADKEKDTFKGKIARKTVESSGKCIYFGMGRTQKAMVEG